MKNIYVVAPAHTYTGGPTALFQLCHYLREYFGVNIKMAFINIKGKNPIHPDYRKFRCKWLPLQRVEDNPRNLIIFPETLTKLMHKFRLSKKAIYWLAVDNFFLTRSHRSKLIRLLLRLLPMRGVPVTDIYQYIAHWEIIRSVKDMKLRKFLNSVDLHIVQSRYARNFLISLDVDEEKVIELREPLEEEFLNTNKEIS